MLWIVVQRKAVCAKLKPEALRLKVVYMVDGLYNQVSKRLVIKCTTIFPVMALLYFRYCKSDKISVLKAPIKNL